MAPELREQIESIAGPMLQGLGYDSTHTGPVRRLTRRELLSYQVRDGVNLVRADAQKRGLMGAIRFRTRMFKESGKVD